MFQAACRGCRIDSVKKTHFYIYTSEYLITESKEFLTKLYNGFNGKLDFGDGQEDCKGKGKNVDKSSNKNNQNGFIPVPANSIKPAKAIIEEIKIDYEIEEQDIEKKYMEIETEILKNKTWAEAFTKMWEFVTNPGFDEKRLQQAMDKYYM